MTSQWCSQICPVNIIIHTTRPPSVALRPLAITNRKSRDTTAARRWHPLIALSTGSSVVWTLGQVPDEMSLIAYTYTVGLLRLSVTWRGRQDVGVVWEVSSATMHTGQRAVNVDFVMIIEQSTGPLVSWFAPYTHAHRSLPLTYLARLPLISDVSPAEGLSGNLSGTCRWAELGTLYWTAIGRWHATSTCHELYTATYFLTKYNYASVQLILEFCKV